MSNSNNNPTMKEEIINNMVAKGVMREDATSYVADYIKWVAMFGESEVDALNTLMGEMKDTIYFYHFTDVTGLQEVAARVGHKCGWNEKDIIEIVDAIGEVDYSCTATGDVLNLCGIEGAGFTSPSKVFKHMKITAFNITV